MDIDALKAHVEAAGGIGGRVMVRFRDHWSPKLAEDHTAVRDEAGQVVHEQSPVGHIRTVLGHVVALVGNTHLALGAGLGKPIDHLIPVDEIEHVTPDLPPAQPESLAPAVGPLHGDVADQPPSQPGQVAADPVPPDSSPVPDAAPDPALTPGA